MNSVTATISALSPGQLDTYEYLTGEEILLPAAAQVNIKS